jgi:hypothetical protein
VADKTYIINYWDTEDYLSPPDAGSDDIILTIAQLAREAGFPACFHIIGERVRSLVGRGRTDIIAELSRHHDTSLHYNYGSIHPTTCELAAVSDWEQGVQIALGRERSGFRLVERTFGRCPALTMHGTTYGPQILRAAGLEGKSFWQVGVSIPESPIYWFCECLCFDPTAHACLDGQFQDDALFEPGLARIAEDFTRYHREGGLLAAYCGHPHRSICREFADVSFYGGVNALHEDLRGPEPMSEPERAIVRRNLGRMLRTLGSLDGFEVTRVSELTRLYRRRPSSFSSSTLRAFAEQALAAGGPVYMPGLTAGEGLLALASALVELRGQGLVPVDVLRMPVLGPLSIPRADPQPTRLTWDEVVDLGSRTLAHARQGGHLPASLIVRGGEVGLGTIVLALAEAYLGAGYGLPAEIALRTAPPWPAAAEGLSKFIDQIPGWPCHDPEMDVSRTLLLSRLMAWTICPAVGPDE